MTTTFTDIDGQQWKVKEAKEDSAVTIKVNGEINSGLTDICRITPDKRIVISLTDEQLAQYESSKDVTTKGIATLVREILRLRTKYES